MNLDSWTILWGGIDRNELPVHLCAYMSALEIPKMIGTGAEGDISNSTLERIQRKLVDLTDFIRTRTPPTV